MGMILSTVIDNKCLVCGGTGKYPSYRNCYECHGTGYIYSTTGTFINMYTKLKNVVPYGNS